MATATTATQNDTADVTLGLTLTDADMLTNFLATSGDLPAGLTSVFSALRRGTDEALSNAFTTAGLAAA